MNISEFFDIFDLSDPKLDKVSYYVTSRDYQSAKKELLKYFVNRKQLNFSRGEEITEKDKNFPLAYISRHFILSGPNEGDEYLSSLFLSGSEDYTSMDILPFLKKDLSVMIMSRQKENAGALFYSPSSIFPPFVALTMSNGDEIKLSPEKYAYISTKSPNHPLYDEDIYEICEESSCDDEAFGSNTGRVYLNFDFSKIDLKKVVSARFSAKIALPKSITRKELLFFNICDSSWTNELCWNDVRGNVYSWESSPTGPTWTSPEGSDSEYLNVTCRFWFARPMAYQYLSDVEKNAVYGERILFLMDAFSKQKEGGFNRVLETGERLSNFTSVLHALIDTPAMTPDYLVSILSMMYRDMKHLCENPDLGWSNWAVVRTSGLCKAIDFLPELKMHEKWKSETRNLLESLFDRMYSSDFSFREAGLNYSFWCLDLFVSAYNSSVINNDPMSSFVRNRFEKAFDASLDLIYPNFYDTNVGDSNYSSKLQYLSRLGKTFPTKKLIAFANGKDDESIALSRYYPYGGSVIMRNTFNKENAIYLALHSIPFDGHAHEDIGNIILYAYGRPLLTDSGRYGYSQGNISAHLKTVRAHNTIEIEGGKYSSHSESGCSISAFASNEAFDYARSEAEIYKDIEGIHHRRVLFMKKHGFAIVSDFVTTNESAHKFKQNWHFMPDADITEGLDNHVKTNFTEGGNIKLLCPDCDLLECEDDIFSSGYGMAEKNSKASFVKYGQNTAMTTVLCPYKKDDIKLKAETLTPEDLSISAMTVSIDSKEGIFFHKNTHEDKVLNLAFEGEMGFVFDKTYNLVNIKRVTASSKVIIESPVPIPDISVKTEGGIVEIVSSSLAASTKRDEAVRIYSPKTTHVILNGEAVPFTLYSDYVYAVKVK